MKPPAARPHVRAAGQGPGVICLHSNASSSSQWRGLIERLAPRWQVLAPDSWGSGQSPEWPSDRVISLQDEVDLVEPLLAAQPGPWVWVGHSYGGAAVLRAAVQRPERVRALVLYEPTLFALLRSGLAGPGVEREIVAVVNDGAAALDAGDPDGAALRFIDYWMGPGSWAATPEHRKPAIAASVRNLRRWGHALVTEPTPIEAFARLDVPVLLMTGAASTAAAHGVARCLLQTLPRVTHVEFAGLGHMAPVTHPDAVNAEIERFLNGLA